MDIKQILFEGMDWIQQLYYKVLVANVEHSKYIIIIFDHVYMFQDFFFKFFTNNYYI
jgi:hypothetical protein